MNNLKDLIIKKSLELEIDLIGFTDSNFDLLLPILEKQEKLDLKSNLQKTDVNNYKPNDLLNSVDTIISIGLSYPNHRNLIKDLEDEYVYFSSCSIGIDYHIVLKEKMLNLCDYIKSLVNNFEYKICVDTTIIDDRFAAYKAGLGFYGKNSLLINPKYGSYIFLGTILTNLNIEKDLPLDMSCLNCDKCINVCPNKAINNSGILDYKKCLSYVTQKKDELSTLEKENIDQCIYGCDLCQIVCPHNKNNFNIHKEFIPLGNEIINVNNYKQLSNKEFKREYGKLSCSFVGKKIIERNINIYKERKKNENKIK